MKTQKGSIIYELNTCIASLGKILSALKQGDDIRYINSGMVLLINNIPIRYSEITDEHLRGHDYKLTVMAPFLENTQHYKQSIGMVYNIEVWEGVTLMHKSKAVLQIVEHSNNPDFNKDTRLVFVYDSSKWNE